ncbi:MAG: metallopeptidase TldD-related protein, partial [Gammaproteobacteria bacterium]|nr:metallopeptidase TldD-related protein [Gammaproteobacteria bacterium]
LDFSGVAKNSFYVEDGEIRYPLIETMVSGNFQDLLLNIRGVSSESMDFGSGEFPYLAASGVTISRP